MPISPNSLVFVHLSDIHFRRTGPAGVITDLDLDVRAQLERDLVQTVARLGQVSAILVTGDVALNRPGFCRDKIYWELASPTAGRS